MNTSTLDHIREIKNRWDFAVVSLEVLNYVVQGRLMKAMQNYVDNPPMLKVKSERGPAHD